MLRHNHHHHLAPGLLQLIKEGIQLVEQLLRPWLIVCTLVRTDKTVTVVQRNDIEEGGAAGITALLLLAQPAGEQFQIVVYRLAVKRRQLIADTGLRHQGCLHITLFAQLFQEVAEHAGVIQHQLFFEAQLGQIIKQIALLVHRLIQVVVRGLAAAGTQQTDCRRAAVGGCRVEVVEHNVHLRPQRVVFQFHRIHVSPGQRTDIDHQQVERLSIGRQTGREGGGAGFFLIVELVQIGRQVGAGGRRAVRRSAITASRRGCRCRRAAAGGGGGAGRQQ